MKLPINPIIRTIAKDEVYVRFEFPSWSTKSLFRWIFTGTAEYTEYVEYWYKLQELPDETH